VVTNDAIVVADYQGYVHWLDKASGAIIAREHGGHVRVTNVPVVTGDMVLVINDHGGITVYRATPLAARAKPAAKPKDSGGE
jgi:outer membrane protein assembly factor BamB